MSNTRHHGKQKTNKDLCSRRPNSYASVSKDNRVITARKERMESRKICHDAELGKEVRGRNKGE